jgi:hypothetical protein
MILYESQLMMLNEYYSSNTPYGMEKSVRITDDLVEVMTDAPVYDNNLGYYCPEYEYMPLDKWYARHKDYLEMISDLPF